MLSVTQLSNATNQSFQYLLNRVGSANLSDGNTSVSFPGHGASAGTLEFRSSGKWYCEATCGQVGQQGTRIGIAPSTFSWDSHLGFSSSTYGWSSASGSVILNGSVIASYSPFTTNDVIAVAFDLTNLKLYFRKNGVWQNSANPETDSGRISISAASWCPAFGSGVSAGSGTSSITKANFGQWPYIYPAPNGYSLFI